MFCVITGASGGIGRATAIEVSKRGAKVILAARKNEKLEQVSEECRGQYLCGDVSDSGFARELFSLAAKDDDAVAAVFAAGFARFGPTERMDTGVWEETLATNLSGLYHCCTAAIDAMLPRGGGRIVNVLSIASKEPFSGAAAYVASKYGGLGLTRSLAAEYRARGIQLTAFMPGSTSTGLWSEQDWKPDPEDMLKPEDVASAIADILFAKSGGVYDEVVFMPPKGVL